MKNSILVVALLAAALISSGCVTKKAAEAKARAAFFAGQQQGQMRSNSAQGPTIFIAGQVRLHAVPWTPGMTLAAAIIAADYQGGDPRVIVLTRGGEEMAIDPRRLLSGEDIPLLSGDSIDLR